MTKPRKRKATLKQIEAYRLVHLLGISQSEAAGIMGVSQPQICKYLIALESKYPEAFESDAICKNSDVFVRDPQDIESIGEHIVCKF